MRRDSPGVRFAAWVALLGVVTQGCITLPTDADDDGSSIPATSIPGDAPAGSGQLPFALLVNPTEANGLAASGAKFIFLVTIDGPTGAAARLSASASGGAVAVEPQRVAPGVVGEVTVVPGPVTAPGAHVHVEIAAERDGARLTATRILLVHNCLDSLRYEADVHLARFLGWLARTQPELGLTPDTTFEAIAAPRAVGEYRYLYLTDSWEIDLQWNVALAPHDWIRIALRARWAESAPSLAFEISSDADGEQPRAIEPPAAVWR